MKFFVIFFSVLFCINADASVGVPTVAFECESEIRFDPATSKKLGMTVEFDGTDYVSYFVGAAEPGPLSTSKQVLPFQEALEIGGVDAILSQTSLSLADQSKIVSVVIYTQGNFDDDAAGVRAVEFLDAQNGVLANGMFFGWAGAFTCN